MTKKPGLSTLHDPWVNVKYSILELLKKHPSGLGSVAISFRISEDKIKTQGALTSLKNEKLIESQGVGRHTKYKIAPDSPPEPREPIEYIPYVPPQDTSRRPGADDHKRYGSRQADGSVKPYAKPVHGCVGFLKDSASNARD